MRTFVAYVTSGHLGVVKKFFLKWSRLPTRGGHLREVPTIVI